MNDPMKTRGAETRHQSDMSATNVPKGTAPLLWRDHNTALTMKNTRKKMPGTARVTAMVIWNCAPSLNSLHKRAATYPAMMPAAHTSQNN